MLEWYDENARTFPWRALPNQKANPYHVWLSEIMLQQTTTTAVIPYFQNFLRKWPTIEELAQTQLDEVLHAWQGLGYYSRARNLHKCAQVIVNEHGGKFPKSEPELLKLPGIGPYTAAAIASIAFDKVATVVDGNVIRVISRLFALESQKPALVREVQALAAPLTSKARPGDWAQAMMDLGATVCQPRTPHCELCPWQTSCQAYVLKAVAKFPVRPKRRHKPTRFGIVFWIQDAQERILIQKRPPKGLLGGMMEFPSTPWAETSCSMDEAMAHAPYQGVSNHVEKEVRHTFTHFHLKLRIVKLQLTTMPHEGLWVNLSDLGQYALPSLMHKVLRAASCG